MATHLQLVASTSPRQASVQQPLEDPALRPTCFDEYIGQTEVLSNVREAVRAAKREGWQLDHMLFAGPAGFGKTSLAAVTATELGSKFRAASAPAIQHKGALMSLFAALEEGDVLFIDEIHALRLDIAECLYPAMEDRKLFLPSPKEVICVPLPRFTLVGATTRAGELSQPLRDRFGFTCQLRAYTLAEMMTIVTRSAHKLGLAIDEGGADTIARASRGTPRVANRLLRRVRDAAANAAADGALILHGAPALTRRHGTINAPLAAATLTRLGIDHLGLEELDRRYLRIVAERPVGLDAICAELAEHPSTIEEVVEPFLMQAGLLQRGGRGRRATEAGQQHLAGAEEIS
jgi:Holliday junction DNA helicase RuvB